MKTIKIWVPVLAATLLCGCFQVEDDLTLQADGSGKVKLKLHSSLPEQVVSMLGMSSRYGGGGAPMYPPTTEYEARKFFPPKDFTLKVEQQSAEEAKTVIVEASFKTANALLATVLTPRDIQRFTAKRQKERVSATTINLDAKILRSALNRARRQGIIQNNPAEAVDLPERQSVERGTFTAAEVKMLIDQAQGTEWATIIMFGYYTGARLGDCTKMEWDHVDLMNSTLKLFETKNKKWVIIPLHPDLQDHLSNLASIDKSQKHITPHMAELGPGGRHGLSEGFKRIAEKAGLDLQKVKGTGVRSIFQADLPRPAPFLHQRPCQRRCFA